MRTCLFLIISAALCFNSFAKEIRRGSSMQVRANSVWFQDETNLTHWQQLKKSGDTSALTSFQEQVLSQRDAWQFVNPRTVEYLATNLQKSRSKLK